LFTVHYDNKLVGVYIYIYIYIYVDVCIVDEICEEGKKQKVGIMGSLSDVYHRKKNGNGHAEAQSRQCSRVEIDIRMEIDD
jgi:hypothetical protein